MAFSESGGVVTQTGTDTVTSSSTIAGTTKSNTYNDVTLFDFGGNRLVVNGTLTLDEGVSFQNVDLSTIGSGAAMTLGASEADPTDYSYNNGVPMLMCNEVSGVAGYNGELNIYGQYVVFGRDIELRNGNSIWRDSSISIEGRFDPTGAGHTVERCFLQIIGAFPRALFVRSVAGSWDKNIVDAQSTNSYFSLSQSTNPGTYSFKNIQLRAAQNLLAYGSISTNRILQVTNTSAGKGYTLDSSTSDNIRNFTLRLFQEIIDTVQDPSSVAIQGAIVYLDGGSGTTVSDTTDVSGELTQSFQYHENIHTAGVSSKTDFISGDTITKRIAKYGFSISPPEIISTLSSQSAEALSRLAIDALITESNEVTVAGYSELNTAQQIYDRAAYELLQPLVYAGESETTITRSGDQVVLADKTLILDATAVSAYDLTGSVVTAKSSTYTGGATATTGSVRVVNGTLLNGGSFDDVSYENVAGTTITGITCTGTLNFTQGGTHNINGGTLNVVTADAPVTLVVDASTTITDSTDPNVTVQAPAITTTIQAPNIIDGSFYQIKNTTIDSILATGTTSGGTGIDETITSGVDYSASDNIRVRIAYQSGTTAKEKLEYNITAGAITATNSNPATQSDQQAYADAGLDGSTITGITWDGSNLQIDIDDPDNNINGQDILAWYYYYVTTATGIEDLFGAFDWLDVNRAVQHVANVDVTFQNLDTVNPLQINNMYFSRDDGTTIIDIAGGDIQINPPAVFAITAGSVYQSTLDAVKAKTDLLTFNGSDLNSNVTKLSGDAPSADNLRLQYDGTGLVGDTFPSSQGQVGAIGVAAGSGLNYAVEADNVSSPIKGVSFVGVQTTNTFTATEAEDGVYHVVDDTGNDIDIVYQFNVTGTRTAVQVVWKGYLNGHNDTATVWAYNFVGGIWETRAIIDGQNNSNNITKNISLLEKHTGTGADVGLVLIRITCSAQSNPTLATDSILTEAVFQVETIGYTDGAIWYDSNLPVPNTGTSVGKDGTGGNPVSSWASVVTLASLLGISRVRIASGSSVTLTGDSTRYQLIGNGFYNLDLNGQIVTDTKAEFAMISGTGHGTNFFANECRFMPDSSTPPGVYKFCSLATTMAQPWVANGTGDYEWADSKSFIPGDARPCVDFRGNSLGTSAMFRGHRGALHLFGDINVAASLDIDEGGTISVESAGGARITGECKAVEITVVASEDIQFVGITGHVDIDNTIGSTTATVGIRGVITDIRETGTSLGANLDDDALRADRQTAIEADTNELQQNQGDWATATGFATASDVTDARDAVNTNTDTRASELRANQVQLNEAAKNNAALNPPPYNTDIPNT